MYESDEEELGRLTIWAANRKFVEQHNSQADYWGYTTEMNEFADMVSAHIIMWVWLIH